MVRLRPPGLGVKGGPQQRIPIATGPPPGYAASAGARSELAMDCPRGLPTFFQYGAGTSGAAAAPRVPGGGTSGAGRRPLGCPSAAPQTCAAARARGDSEIADEEIATEIRSRYARDVNLHRISPRRGTRARHLRCRPGSRARFVQMSRKRARIGTRRRV